MIFNLQHQLPLFLGVSISPEHEQEMVVTAERWNAYGLGTINFAIGSGSGCNLLGPHGIALQVAITVVCAAAFIAVWFMEPDRRPFLTWVFDISKQVVGAAYGKMWNIAQSIIFAKLLLMDPKQQDQCIWYFMSISVDCLFLTMLLWPLCNYCRPILLERYNVDIGAYNEPIGADCEGAFASKEKGNLEPCELSRAEVQAWVFQLGIWLGLITTVRLFISIVLFFVQHEFYTLCDGLLTSLGLERPAERLTFVVLVFPMFADVFQIVVQDHFLKKHA